MNIMHFADYSAPYEGNFILTLKALEAKLKSKNINMVYVFTKGAKQQEWAKQLLNKKTAIFFLEDGFIKNILLFMKIIRRYKIRLIHTHFSIFKFDLMLKIARILSRKTVYVRHMHMLYKKKANPIMEKIKRLVANADIEITCSQAVYQAMESAGFKAASMVNITNAVDFARLDNYEKLDLKMLGVPDNSKIILMFGYSYLVKGVDLAVRAVRSLNSKGQSTRLLIVAADNTESIKENIADDFGNAEEYVKFLPPRNDIASYYKLADVFLSASRSEGLSYALIEAKYCGVLTVASDIPGNVRTDSEFMFESENSLALTEKLEYAFGISDEHKSKTVIGQQRFVVEEFGMDKWSNEIIKIYLKALE